MERFQSFGIETAFLLALSFFPQKTLKNEAVRGFISLFTSPIRGLQGFIVVRIINVEKGSL
jgi:hypothetical protein